jgi:phospholipid transport system substrate-binding protein
MTMKRPIFIFLMMFICIPSLAHSARPIDVLKGAIDESISILKDPHYRKVAQKDLQHEKLWKIIQRVFDFKEFSKRVLGSNWKKFTPQQRKEFTNVFAKFLSKSYLRKVQERYKEEKFIFLSQDLSTDSKALVKTKIRFRSLEVPVNIRMLRRNGDWKVYDVIVLGVSAAKNYRAQFYVILLKESPAELIKRLKKKNARQAKK